MAVVYAIRNKENGKVYIGQTRKRLAIRWDNHRYSARKGSPHFIRIARKTPPFRAGMQSADSEAVRNVAFVAAQCTGE